MQSILRASTYAYARKTQDGGGGDGAQARRGAKSRGGSLGVSEERLT